MYHGEARSESMSSPLDNLFQTLSTTYIPVGVLRPRLRPPWMAEVSKTYGTVFDQYIHVQRRSRTSCAPRHKAIHGQKKRPRVKFHLRPFWYFPDFSDRLDHRIPSDTQACTTDTAQIGAVPVKYLFCHIVCFHGGGILCLFLAYVKQLVCISTVISITQ